MPLTRWSAPRFPCFYPDHSTKEFVGMPRHNLEAIENNEKIICICEILRMKLKFRFNSWITNQIFCHQISGGGQAP